MIQDLSGSWCIKGTGASMTRVDSPVPLMHHDPDRPWITDPDPDHPKGTHPYSFLPRLFRLISSHLFRKGRWDEIFPYFLSLPSRKNKKS